MLSLNKNEDLEKLIAGLDITPTMYKNAENKYKALAYFFEKNGLECDIYPQGSFALGTVIRPFREGKQRDYDLDFICLVNFKENTSLTSKNLKNLIGELLKNNEIYKDKLTEYEKCWTLSYAEVNNIGFNIDIIPAIPTDNNFILITDKNFESDTYNWILSNPKNFIEWFEEINLNYPNYSLVSEEMNIVKNSVEELPELFKRTSLQRVIQILKYHRDSYYCKRKKENKKVISAIITTLCAQVAKNKTIYSSNIENLLKDIIKELKIYSDYLIISEDNFDKRYNNKKVIKKSNNNWEIINPVNPQDNLADQWNEDNEKAMLFFDWINCIYKEFIEADNTEYIYSLESIFGKEYVDSKLSFSAPIQEIRNSVIEVTPAKPWRE